MKLGEPINLHMASRYYQFNRSFAIRDVFDVLVELITNSDDSYHRLFKKGLRNEDGGRILVEYLEQRKQQSSHLFVYDRAEGMNLEQMKERLADVGSRRSEEGDRGFMGRGAKDCTELGPMVFESIKDDRHYKCELTPKPQFIPQENGRKVTQEIRDRLHIPRGNGTVVHLEIEAGHTKPRFETLVRDLPWHFALRDVLAEGSHTQVLARNLNQPNQEPTRLVHRSPVGQLMCDETFEIPGYADAKARLRLWKSPDPFLDDLERRFRRSGVSIRGDRAIWECSLFSPEFERDIHARNYFGRLECPYIDQLLREYDDRRENERRHPADNPKLLVDPNRQEGLMRDHPFTTAMLLIPSERLRAFIAKDRNAEKVEQREIANEQMQNRLNRLARKAGEFLKQQLEDIQELTDGEDVDKSSFAKLGVLIFPTYLNVALGEERCLTYYAKSSISQKTDHIVSVTADDSALLILDAPFELKPHRTKEDQLVGSFRVRGESLKDSVVILATCGSLPQAEAIARVVENKIEEHAFIEPLEFEFNEYSVREGAQKSLELFAKFPEVVTEPTYVTLASSDSLAVPVRGRCQLMPVIGSNYARGTVTIQGRKLNAKAAIRASVQGREAATNVRVVQRPPDKSIPIEIKLRDEDFGNYRARWADHEGKPHLLLVSARHKSLSRYLGPPPDYLGQEEPHFRVLLAEIVAESVCRKSLGLEAQERSWEFRWADLKEDRLIADDVIAKLQKRIRDFAADAHEIMLSSAEIRKLVSRPATSD